MFSKACEYGIRAIIYIAQQSQQGRRVPLKMVAKAIDSPVAFTAKILQSLAKDELIVSTKGIAGGYEILKERLATITLSEVVQAIDGDQLFTGCGLGLKECNELKPCPVHYQFVAIREGLKQMMERTTIRDMALELNLGAAFLKR